MSSPPNTNPDKPDKLVYQVARPEVKEMDKTAKKITVVEQQPKEKEVTMCDDDIGSDTVKNVHQEYVTMGELTGEYDVMRDDESMVDDSTDVKKGQSKVVVEEKDNEASDGAGTTNKASDLPDKQVLMSAVTDKVNQSDDVGEKINASKTGPDDSDTKSKNLAYDCLWNESRASNSSNSTSKTSVKGKATAKAHATDSNYDSDSTKSDAESDSEAEVPAPVDRKMNLHEKKFSDRVVQFWEYKTMHDGDANPKRHYVTPDGTKLGEWLHNQCKKFQDGTALASRTNILQEMGVIFDKQPNVRGHKKSVAEGILEIKKFRKVNGENAKVKEGEDPWLYRWIQHSKTQWKKNLKNGYGNPEFTLPLLMSLNKLGIITVPKGFQLKPRPEPDVSSKKNNQRRRLLLLTL